MLSKIIFYLDIFAANGARGGMQSPLGNAGVVKSVAAGSEGDNGRRLLGAAEGLQTNGAFGADAVQMGLDRDNVLLH